VFSLRCHCEGPSGSEAASRNVPELLAAWRSRRDRLDGQSGGAGQLDVRGDEGRPDLVGEADVEGIAEAQVTPSAPGSVHERADRYPDDFAGSELLVGEGSVSGGCGAVEFGSPECAGDFDEVVLGYPPVRQGRQFFEKRSAGVGVEQDVGASGGVKGRSCSPTHFSTGLGEQFHRGHVHLEWLFILAESLDPFGVDSVPFVFGQHAELVLDRDHHWIVQLVRSVRHVAHDTWRRFARWTGSVSLSPARLGSESVLVRLIATIGVVAIGTVVGGGSTR
jgi:hypothetical protein